MSGDVLAWLSVWNAVQTICTWFSWCQLPPPPNISCFVKIQSGLTFLVPAYPRCPGKETVKRLSVCNCVTILHRFRDISTAETDPVVPKFSLGWTLCRILLSVTYRRSVAKRGVDVFSVVCLSVSLFARTITSERLNVGWWNLATRRTVQKSRPSSHFGSKVKRSRSPGQKKRKTAESSPLTVHSKVCIVGRTQQAPTDDAIAWPPGGDGLRQRKNQRMLSSCLLTDSTALWLVRFFWASRFFTFSFLH